MSQTPGNSTHQPLLRRPTLSMLWRHWVPSPYQQWAQVGHTCLRVQIQVDIKGQASPSMGIYGEENCIPQKMVKSQPPVSVNITLYPNPVTGVLIRQGKCGYRRAGRRCPQEDRQKLGDAASVKPRTARQPKAGKRQEGPSLGASGSLALPTP